MSSILKRVQRRYTMTIENYRNDCQFSNQLAFYRLLGDLSRRAGMKQIAKWANNHKDQWILSYLRKVLRSVIDKYKDVDFEGYEDSNSPIWVCWWTGEEDAPQLVKQCIKSIRKNAGGHPVNLVTERNYAQYVDVPDYILEKMESGKMKTAHFSDYLRVSLLEQYGGLWLDATIFCSKVIPETYFQMPLFTCKSEVIRGMYLSDFQWVTFCLGGWRECIFYTTLKEMFELYWRQNDRAIDYLFFDCLIYIVKETNLFVLEQLKNVPVNNIHRDDLAMAMCNGVAADELYNILKEDTVLYKLSWREEYPQKGEGKGTVYNAFLEMNM